MLTSDTLKDFQDNYLDRFLYEYGFLYLKDNEEKITDYGESYKELKLRIFGETRINSIKKDIEKVAIDALDFEKPTEVSRELIAWKAGKLDIDKEGKYYWNGRNGRGTKLENVDIFLIEVNKKSDIYNDKAEFSLVYESLTDIIKGWNRKHNDEEKKKIKGLGAVYIISLIYFLSKGKFPIYDYFAHKAAKAIYCNKNPKDVFIGSAPGRDEKQKVFSMYNEYCWLLKQIFSEYNKNLSNDSIITREQDQALWVYGHSEKQYPKDIEQRD